MPNVEQSMYNYVTDIFAHFSNYCQRYNSTQQYMESVYGSNYKANSYLIAIEKAINSVFMLTSNTPNKYGYVWMEV